jgi:hypothetical protein
MKTADLLQKSLRYWAISNLIILAIGLGLIAWALHDNTDWGVVIGGAVVMIGGLLWYRRFSLLRKSGTTAASPQSRGNRITEPNLYVGNLPIQASEEELQRLFKQFGTVVRTNILRDKYTGEVRGYGFIEMATAAQAEAAIEGLDGQEFQGEVIRVSTARSRSRRRA